ncbi:MAG: IPT/TIG domain-containing protein [Myxococcaceae bacterium]|nr:IPT/TIG domain-containing protein [Myxococcaceae bacterium]
MRWSALLLLAAVVSACNCGPRPGRDGGMMEDDAGTAGGSGTGGGTNLAGGMGGSGGGEEVDAGPAPMLRIQRVLPPRGPSAGNTTVTLTGSGFLRDFAGSGSQAKPLTQLRFGMNPVIDYIIIDDRTLELRTPPGTTGQQTVRITNPNGTFLCSNCFTYYDELVVTGTTPRESPMRGGGTITIDGAGFTADTLVLIGGQATPEMTLVSPARITAVIPRGLVDDLVDVTVYNKNGAGTLRRHFRYFKDLRISGVTPATAPINDAATSVVITGQGFTGATSVRFGAVDATGFTVDSDTSITVTAPSSAMAGAVDLNIVTPRDAWVAKKAFSYYDPAGTFAAFAVFPHVAYPGQQVTLMGHALNAGMLNVTIGGQPVTVGARTFSTAVLTVPLRGGAARKADVVANTATLAQGFTFRVAAAALAPPNGPSAGGTAATLTGTAIPADALIAVGALDATGVVVTGEASATLVTPKGSGGQANELWVREAADVENEAVLGQAFTFDEPLSIGRVSPDRGAIAGNTLVTVLGSGFGIGNATGTLVKFGGNVCKDIKVVDQHTLTCRTPKGDVGTVDVTIERLGPTDQLPGGFSYFDPRSISGGLSGGPLVGTLNVTVLESTQGAFGAPVPLASVILGVDSSTPFQGLTDSRGQITFSDPSLVKAQTVTVYKENFATTTVTAVNAENLTVFVARTGGGEPSPGQPPPGVPPSQISGRVTGFKAPRMLVMGETLEARVFVAQTSLYGGPPFRSPGTRAGEKWQVVADGGEYLVFSAAGLRAVYAVMGIANRNLNSFTPYLMGVKRGVTTSADTPATNQNIILDTYLDMTVPIRIDGALKFSGNDANNNVYAWLDLGAEGFVPNPNNWATGTQVWSSVSGTLPDFQFPNFPRLDGDNFIFMNIALGTLPTDPYSLYFRRQPGNIGDGTMGVTIGTMLPPPHPVVVGLTNGQFNGNITWTLPPGPTANILQVNVFMPTLAGNVTLWSVVLPGTETQVALPPPAVLALRNAYMGTQLGVQILASRSPKFAYNQWTYDTLSGVSWSSYTLTESDPFLP